MRLYFLNHSAFALTGQKTALVFDYSLPYSQGEGFAKGRVDSPELAEYERVFFFASHGHGDHYNRDIFEYTAPNVRYILSGGIACTYDAVRLDPGECFADDGIEVRAFGSTDEGVSFYVCCEGRRIFHAGDLNCWHWMLENDEQEEAEARKAFSRELDILKPAVTGVDVAMFPVDGRMKGPYDDGAEQFIAEVRPKLFVPMHFWNKFAVAEQFARKHKNVFAPSFKGESIEF